MPARLARLGGMTRYIGSGPYCYANCLAMVMADGTDPGLLEVLTGAPFGTQLLAGERPLFDPLGWDPEAGIDAALDLLGWSCQRRHGGGADAALARLRRAVGEGPVLAGPVELGLLGHHPGIRAAIGADHYLLVFAAEDGLVRFHDPHGHPYATLPWPDFAAAWRGESIGYTADEYMMRNGFRRARTVAPLDALRASVPAAAGWLHGKPGQAPPGSLGGADAALAMADLADRGLTDGQRADLVWFAVRVGARRLADAEYWLGQIGLASAAVVAGRQARLVGGLQYPLVTGDDAAVAATLRALAPTYHELARALSQ
jgi:hypothetical protein